MSTDTGIELTPPIARAIGSLARDLAALWIAADHHDHPDAPPRDGAAVTDAFAAALVPAIEVALNQTIATLEGLETV